MRKEGLIGRVASGAVMPEPESSWRDPFFLAEIISITALALWLVAQLIVSLNPYFVVSVGIVLYFGFLASLLIRKTQTDKLRLQMRQAELQTEQMKTFTTEVQARGSERFDSAMARRQGVEIVIMMIGETLRDANLSQDKRIVYEEVLARVKDVQRGVSPTGW